MSYLYCTVCTYNVLYIERYGMVREGMGEIHRYNTIQYSTVDRIPSVVENHYCTVDEDDDEM